ncbi:hypothetical protein ACVILL_003358 [Bradyrhizobium sp. USDA 3364]
MRSVLKDGGGETAGKPPRRMDPLRLRGKGPLWAGLVILLAVDLVLAAAAWNAVGFFRH